MSLFLTGTDTGVGKTYTAANLLRLMGATGIRCVGYKPICCGDRHDAELLLAASGDGVTLDEVNPVWLKTPAAPFPATLVEGVQIDAARLLAGLRELQARFDCVIVEGVGGWLVPIRRDYFVSDLAMQMQLPVVIVAMNRLGCLNHSMLTARAVAAAGLACAGIVLNSVGDVLDHALRTNCEILTAIAEVPIVSGLSPEMEQLPADWQELLTRVRAPGRSDGNVTRIDTSVTISDTF